MIVTIKKNESRQREKNTRWYISQSGQGRPF